MKKPATGRAAVPAKKAAPVKAAPKKPAAKKPSPAAAAAHKAHLAHVAHLAHIGKAPAKAAPKKRQLALGAGVACCAAEAVAASLRLTGRPVSDAEVLELYWRTASDPDAGASILATLEAASEFGLAGLYPRWTPAGEPLCTCGFIGAGRHGLGAHEVIGCAAEEARGVIAREHAPHAPLAGPVGAQFGPASAHGLILGVDLPGPHAVLATPDGWWSWGQLYDPVQWPDAVIEEAWAIEWGM